MTIGYRSNDAVVTICQNNAVKSIEISHVNKAAEELLGYSHSQLAGNALASIVPPRIAEMLSEYVEFESGGNDVGEVLAKVQSFSVVGQDGKESGYRLKVVRTDSAGDKHRFELVLQDKTGLRKNESLRKAIYESFKGHEVIDPTTGLPDAYSLGRDIELLSPHNNKGDLRSCFAIMQIDHADELFAQYGREAFTDITRHIALVCRQNLRPDDVIGFAGRRRIGVLLLDAAAESTRIVFNRLRWQIAASPFILPDRTSIGLSVSISFCRVGGEKVHKDLIEDCEKALDEMGAAAVNALVEL